MVVRGKSVMEVATKMKIPRTTLGREYNKFMEGDFTEVDEYLEQRTSQLVLLTLNKEDAVEKYALWQQKRGMPLFPKQIKALIREIHAQAIERGEKRQQINMENGPSTDYMQLFYQRHSNLSFRSGETGKSRNSISLL